ncbi:metallophosphoesterase [Methanoregula formicica]|uniref:Calcineurin-like phosphoesterase n=1 Tax=Methanoregula formicica (strain DSM 22288 / NBRC 105244 / SMSP) TaxID=593750 RepID=L0HG82_METFS|nr:metallophosphoesterase [Methanoregula formicica]AGB02328.1 Calcineurin-like phosphoesterase [Methanoregula formicica SMSP]
MGSVIFSDVHADVSAIGALSSCIRTPAFRKTFGPIDLLVNLGDLLHRGSRPQETLEKIHTLSRECRLVSVLGNHDHAYLNGIMVSGSDVASTYRHEQLRDSPLLSIFDAMPMEYTDHTMLFVHGGPLELGDQTLRLKCWQRLSHQSGDFFTGYHYTAQMAFDALEKRGLSHMACGHQHEHICCRKTPEGIIEQELDFVPLKLENGHRQISLEVARVPLDCPTLFRVGGCHGDEPEFAYSDYSTFSFIRLLETI